MKHILSIISGIVIGALCLGLYFHFKPVQAPTNVFVPATESPELKSILSETIPLDTGIKVFKPEAKKKLKLPSHIVEDKKQSVIASSKTANDERQHTVTTVIDTTTGKSTTYDRVEPLPIFAINTKSMVGMYYGIKNGQQAIRVEAHQEVFQIKAVHVGAVASADFMPIGTDTFIGVGAWARW
jgi:hypothetical protein